MKKIILILVILLTTGCYDYVELNNISIVSSIGIDYIDNEFILTLEILDDNNSSYVVSTKGKTIVNAFDNVRIVFSFCYRCVESAYFYPVPLLVRQSAQALLDVVWFRPAASSNGSDIYMVYSCSLKISFCTFWACQRTNNYKNV